MLCLTKQAVPDKTAFGCVYILNSIIKNKDTIANNIFEKICVILTAPHNTLSKVERGRGFRFSFILKKYKMPHGFEITNVISLKERRRRRFCVSKIQSVWLSLFLFPPPKPYLLLLIGYIYRKKINSY